MPQGERLAIPWRMPSSQVLWDALSASIGCFVAVIDPEYRVRSINRIDPGCDATGVIGRSVFEFMPAAESARVRPHVEEVFSQGKSVALDLTLVDDGGQTIVSSIRASPVIEEGRVVAAVLTSHGQRQQSSTELALRAERKGLRRLLQTQEAERQMVSYEIHDGLAQYLTSASMHLEACGHALDSLPALTDSFRSDFAAAQRLVGSAIAESRRLINGLRPPLLDELGIIEAVNGLLDEMAASGVAVEYVHPPHLPELASDVATALFRIVQESLSNIRKHARAGRVRVALLACGDSDVSVEVSDDGVGFSPEAILSGCFGLEGIRQRARLFGREATIESGLGRGTRVSVVLPLKSQPAD